MMMNVEVMFYAAQELGDERLKEVALKHCLTTRRFLVRGDGSTAHEGIFDLDSGAFLCQSSHQGWRGDSSWARVQAWAIGGVEPALLCYTEKRIFVHPPSPARDSILT